MDDEGHIGSIPGLMIPLGPIILIAIVFLVIRKRRQSKDERALSRIVNAIDESELPDRAKEILRHSVDEVRGAMSAIRDKASEIRSN
ncbi:MAG TPA: hypothetical protein VEX37_14960 [Thermomicrobiales bacterium]|nr:hypothetical protein [Thermomicrobiales bacterium]